MASPWAKPRSGEKGRPGGRKTLLGLGALMAQARNDGSTDTCERPPARSRGSNRRSGCGGPVRTSTGQGGEGRERANLCVGSSDSATNEAEEAGDELGGGSCKKMAAAQVLE